MSILSTAFWKASIERAVKTAAQSVIVLWGVGDQIFNAFDVDWATAGGVAAGGFLLSIITSVASGALSSTPGPSVGGVEQLPHD